ncbi:hypothetical protein [Nocardioides zeicaulis]|uniref:DUF4190 domain-containing protein n=1 Tax=Nocardioides zeicaulis TaxID=1776857 RepID=A0ABV6DZA2_9ACTN
MSEKDQPHDETQPVRPQAAAPQPAPGGGGTPTAEPAAEPAADPAVDRATTEQPAAGQPAPSAAYAPPPPPPGRGWGRARRWRDQAPGDRAYGLGALIASALAGVILGTVGTAVFHAVADDHGPGDRFGQHGPMPDRDGRRGPMFGGGPGVPGQLQPTTPPEDDDSSS